MLILSLPSFFWWKDGFIRMNSKQLGAEQMFEQSLVYLYNSYREDGLPAEEAKKQVALHIEKSYKKYEANNILPKKDTGIVSPLRVVEDMIKGLEQVEPPKHITKSYKNVLIRQLFHLKKVLGG